MAEHQMSCGSCGSVALTGLRLCVDCRSELELGLVALPESFELCTFALEVRPPGGFERVGGGRPHGIALRGSVVHVRSEVLAVLASWCGFVVAERGVLRPDEFGIRALVAFLGVHVQWLAAHPAAGDLVAELTELNRAATDVLTPASEPGDRPASADVIPADWAPPDGEHRTVPTELAALALGVTPATVRKWASRGKLTRYGRPGRAEYSLTELYELRA